MDRVTLQDVANQAGVSIKTVSRVLNNEPNVASDTADKVKQAMHTLKYVPNFAARNLSRGQAMAIGLVIGWPINNPYVSALIDYSLKESLCHGYSLALFSLYLGSSKQVVDACLGGQVDGLILDTRAGDDEELVSQLHALNLPYVVIHPNRKNSYSKASCVEIDNMMAAKQATGYLIAIGHRAIGYVGTNIGFSHEKEREDGYQRAFVEAGLPCNPEWCYTGNLHDSAFEVGFSGSMNLLSSCKELTAFFAETDEVAFGVVNAVWQSGLKVPDDISVIGFDDIVYASMIAPPLTTVHQPLDEILRIAVEQIIKMINEPGGSLVDVILPTRLVVRQTCRPPRRVDEGLELSSRNMPSKSVNPEKQHSTVT
jgi:DNA-binding LacI/PurR family transcriptional regulator